MKRGLLKFANILTYVMIGSTGLYTVAALLYGVLPADVTTPVMEIIRVNTEAIIPVGISAGVASLGVIALKIGSKTLNEKLHQSTLALQLWETDIMTKINNRTKIQENLNDVVVVKQNTIIKNQETLINQLNAMIGFNVANAQRNLLASDELVPPAIKDIYRQTLKGLADIKYDVTPITKIIEETIIREVEAVKEISKVNW